MTEPAKAGTTARERSQTLDRGLALLEELGSLPGGLTITELAVRLEVSRAVVYRLVATLEEHGYVRRLDDGRVRMGFRVLELAASVAPLLRAAALPVLRRLAEEVGATAHLTVAEGAEAVAVAVVEPSWTNLHVAYRVGSRHPVQLGAAGRAILALRTGAEAAFVVTEGELQPGAHGIAAPVRGVSVVEASVGVVALQDLDAERVGPHVVQAAHELARQLG